MGGAYGMYGGEERSILGLGAETRGEVITWSNYV